VVLDSSAIIAIHTREQGHQGLQTRIEEAKLVVVGTPTLVETAMVLSSRLGHDARPQLRGWLRDFNIEVLPFTETHADAAIVAFRRFGKGRHAAALSMGDCMAYAVASTTGLPLLCVGGDFARTDITLA